MNEYLVVTLDGLRHPVQTEASIEKFMSDVFEYGFQMTTTIGGKNYLVVYNPVHVVTIMARLEDTPDAA